MLEPAAPEAAWQGEWRLLHSDQTDGVMRFVPDLSVHLVFDVTGLIDVEPFLIHTGNTYQDLVLPAGVQLIGLQFAVWEALGLSEVSNDPLPTYSIRFDSNWAHYFYFVLLEARNNGLSIDKALHSLHAFQSRIDGSLRKDLSQHFFQITTNPLLDEDFAYSERHQRRLYQAFTGLSPNQFKRIMRFQKTLQAIRATGTLTWDDYYDQPHFIREFKEFTGLTPSQFLHSYG